MSAPLDPRLAAWTDDELTLLRVGKYRLVQKRELMGPGSPWSLLATAFLLWAYGAFVWYVSPGISLGEIMIALVWIPVVMIVMLTRFERAEERSVTA